MSPKNKAFRVGCLTLALTALVTIFRELEPGYAKGIWAIWSFFAWNFFAYAFDWRMLPWQFIELKGGKEGNPTERTVFFWGTAAVYLAFLAVMAFAN